MRKFIVSKVVWVGLLACLLVACNEKKQTFTIQGEIAGGEGKTLYLENVATSGIVVLDSARLHSENFRFERERPACPDFYRLRLGNQVINLAIDSTETLTVKADTAHFAREYSLEGDVVKESQHIKELTLLHAKIARQYHALQKQHEAGELPNEDYIRKINRAIDDYKVAAREYIIADFLSPSAYFALFQQIDRLFIFDIYDKDDNKLFGAVANAWNTVYPESPRTLQLKNLFTGARAIMRGEQPVEAQEAESTVLFDLTLPSTGGKEIRLSDIARGKVTLIDFTVYSGSGSPAHNLQLSELYNQYRSQGLEIYQISLDSDSHWWKNAAVNLPWICVRDAEIGSPAARKYNVREIPATFIRDREGEIVARVEDYSKLNALVSGLLKK